MDVHSHLVLRSFGIYRAWVHIYILTLSIARPHLFSLFTIMSTTVTGTPTPGVTPRVNSALMGTYVGYNVSMFVTPRHVWAPKWWTWARDDVEVSGFGVDVRRRGEVEHCGSGQAGTRFWEEKGLDCERRSN